MPCVIDMLPPPFPADELPRPYILKMRAKIADEFKDNPVKQARELARYDEKYSLKVIGPIA